MKSLSKPPKAPMGSAPVNGTPGKGYLKVPAQPARRWRLGLPGIGSRGGFLIYFAIGLFVVVALTISFWAPNAEPRPTATLTPASGTPGSAVVTEAEAAQYQVDKNDLVPLRKGVRLAGGQNVQIVAAGSRVVLTLSDGGKIFIGPYTTLHLSELVESASGIKATRVILQNGMVYLSGRGSRYQVVAGRQSNWSAEVNGSKMGVKYDGIDSFMLECFEGNCVVNGNGSSLPIMPGKAGGIQGKTFSTLRPVDFRPWQTLAGADVPGPTASPSPTWVPVTIAPVPTLTQPVYIPLPEMPSATPAENSERPSGNPPPPPNPTMTPWPVAKPTLTPGSIPATAIPPIPSTSTSVPLPTTAPYPPPTSIPGPVSTPVPYPAPTADPGAG